MVNRREFLRHSAAFMSFILSGCIYPKERYSEGKKKIERAEEKKPMTRSVKSPVYVIKTQDRRVGIKELLENFDVDKLGSKKVAIKANYNSADPFPASTHIDTLVSIVDTLKEQNADIILAERSGMGDTRRVLEKMGVLKLAAEKSFDVVVLDEVREGWIRENPENSHWKRGYLFPKVFREVDAIVQTCCLKTHRFGGHFTLSLKNSVGMVAKFDPVDGYNYMAELHTSRHMRKMIAEINTSYQPEFVILDAIQGFSKGGPETGTLIQPGIIMASSDRVAIDAAGVAVLRIYGTTREVSEGSIFQQEQIARASELGLGAGRAEEIEIIPVNEEAQDICARIEEKLMKPDEL
jgi:uncharacterized protein (DUF362 family)